MIKKEILVAVSVATLLLGCVDTSTGAAARADMEGGSEKVETKAAPAAKAEAAPVVEKAAAPAPAAEEAPAAEAAPAEAATEEAPKEEAAPAEAEAPAAEAAAPAAASVNLTACAACHGTQFEKVAMGVSKVVKDMSKEEIVASLKGYKDGTYGGAMKALMAGQVASFDDAMIEAAAAEIKK
ncbi:MAG: hypothetical protein K0U38_10530 [Epsilonproteobacteria bacterium]|nr:hypothetical protein [Campylobacterota bacterium]